MTSLGLKSFVLLKSSHGSVAAERASFICAGLVMSQRERLFFLPFDVFYEDKNGRHTGHTLRGQVFRGPDIPVYCWPVIPDV